MKKILPTIPFLSSTIQSTYSKSYKLIYDQFNEAIKVPQKWVEDIKHVEFNELLASSIGPLALFFNWKKRHKEEFSEIASGALASSFVHGDPIGTITSIVVLAYRYNQSTNKQEMRNIHGDEQVLLWRRSYDLKPPIINIESHKKLINQECFKKVDINPFPKNESLKDTFNRLKPFLTSKLFPLIEKGKNILISAHGNSIRAMLKFIENISDEDIIKIEIPTGEPILLEFIDGILQSKRFI